MYLRVFAHFWCDFHLLLPIYLYIYTISTHVGAFYIMHLFINPSFFIPQTWFPLIPWHVSFYCLPFFSVIRSDRGLGGAFVYMRYVRSHVLLDG